MRCTGFTLIEALVVVAIVVILAAIFFPVFGRSHGSTRNSCQSNLKQISLGIKQYESDNNDRFPPVAVARSGYWAGSIQPYLKSWQIFQCPTARNGNSDQGKSTDYFYNARLAQVSEGRIEATAQTITFGDGSDNSPLNYALSQLPDAWRQDQKSPAWRHLEGANYAFVDGHVKWLKPEQVSTDKPNNNFTFAVK